MNSVETVNDILVNLFNEIMDIEERALITSEYKDISVKDMHVIEAVGKKGYVNRVRSEEDRRVVLVSLSEKGEQAYHHHRIFHERMVMSVLKDLNKEETESLTAALMKLQEFFRNYRTE